ncbi:MAG: DUF452 family protein [Bacteroidales bacterium]|nr:DUF452 family protein [Bacteroidales bacterium]
MQTIKHINGSNKAILFFNGWGMDENIAPETNDFDVFILQQYHSEGEFPIKELVAYDEIYLCAWSMGVWAAEQQNWQGLNIKQAVAINGTSSGIDDLFGIPEANFQATLDHFSEVGLQKFTKRMCRKLPAEFISSIMNKRLLEDQREELAWFIAKSKTIEKRVIHWNKAFIGSNDLIFPAENLNAFWMDELKATELEMPHFPFFHLDSWNKIFNL